MFARPFIKDLIRNIFAGGFDPLQLASLRLWLDGADAATITKDGSNNISQWNDKSGKLNHAIQATGANQPLFDTSHINGNSVVAFDGTNERMLLTFALALTGEFTIFIVANNEDTTTSRLVLGNSAGTNKIGTLNPTLAFERIVAGGASDFTQPYLNQSITGIETIRRDALDKIDIAFNAAPLTRIFGDTAVSGTSSWNVIGGDNVSLDWFGDIAEVIIYDQALSTVDCALVTTYLSTKWLDTINNWENLARNWEDVNINWEDLT